MLPLPHPALHLPPPPVNSAAATIEELKAVGLHMSSWPEWDEEAEIGPFSWIPDAQTLGHDAASWNAHRRAAELWYQGRDVQLFKIAGGARQVGTEVVETIMELDGQAVHTLERISEDGAHLKVCTRMSFVGLHGACVGLMVEHAVRTSAHNHICGLVRRLTS